MDMSPKEYQKYVQQKSPKSPIVKDTVLAFVIGGLICVIGQAIQNGWSTAGLGQEDAGTARYREDWRRRLRRSFNARNFYLTAEGLCYFFPMYALAPAAEGIPTFTVPYRHSGEKERPSC